MNNKLLIISTALVATYASLIVPAIAKSTTREPSETIEIAPENLPSYTIAQTGRYAFSIIRLYSGRNILLQSVSTGNKFDVYYASSIEPEVGDVISVIMENGTWTTLINERTGKSSAVTSVQRKY